MEDARVLLIVDDSNVVLQVLSELLTPYFLAVHTALSPSQAEQHLSQHKVTDLICDHNLGENCPCGVELVPMWRTKHETIQFAIIYTGRDKKEFPQAHPLIDAVVQKGKPMNELLEVMNVPN